jgi:hypothetical protein
MFGFIKKFFNREASKLKEKLDDADKDLIRVVDDVVDTLIRLGLVVENDLPVDAVVKLKERREIRKQLEQSLGRK